MIGIMGACRSQELVVIAIEHLREEGHLLVGTQLHNVTCKILFKVRHSAFDLRVDKNSKMPNWENEEMQGKKVCETKMIILFIVTSFEQITNSNQVISSKGGIIMYNCIDHVHNYKKKKKRNQRINILFVL